MKHTIKVQQKHINAARKAISAGCKRCNFCPVALALCEHFNIHPINDDEAPIWTVDYMAMINGANIYLPDRAGRFIRDFDQDQPVKRFQFTINV